MDFYYFSIFSFVPLGIAYGVLALIYWSAVRASRGIPARKALLSAIGALFLVLPISEELWIAWNFGQACKEAGTIIFKKMQVEGFYDDTTHWWRQLAESKYQFVESRDRLHDALWRVERAGDEIKHFKIDRPTARYWYSMDQGRTISHKVRVQQATVVDKESGELLARFAEYNREAPWYFISLGRPRQSCDAQAGHGGSGFLVYQDVLIPSASTSGVSK